MKNNIRIAILFIVVLSALILAHLAISQTTGALTKTPALADQQKIKPPLAKLDSDPKTITVTSPSSNSVFVIGSISEISWKYTGEPGTVKIEFANTATKTPVLIATDIPGGHQGLGTYKWKAPDLRASTTSYVVKVTSMANAAVTGLSQPFSILPPSITIITPTPLQRCSTIVNIAWNSLGDTFGPTVRITAWQAGSSGATKDLDIQYPLNQGKYQWKHPVDKNTDFYIRVESAQTPSIADQRLIHMMAPIQIGTPGPEPYTPSPGDKIH
jgi:hypothetical protein